MSRSASCIQMLLLLKARGCMSREELAQELACNKRNILEYKKELEEAGYVITSTSGKYGGYALKGGTLLPVTSFTREEQYAIQEARQYIMSHNDFLLHSEYGSAMDKLQSNLQKVEEEGGVYVRGDRTHISKHMQHMIKTFEQAKNTHHCIELHYRSLQAKKDTTLQVHPYELLNYKGNYYCLGYSLKAKDYRMFKFSEERMKDLKLLPQTFQRDYDFHIKDHIGKSGLVKGELYEIELLIYHETARWIAEKQIGIEPQMKWVEEDTLYLKTMMEGKIETIAFLLSLKNECHLLSPPSLRQEMLKIIEDMKREYTIS